MECPRRRNITYKETGEIWFMTVRVMRFLPGMSRYFHHEAICFPGSWEFFEKVLYSSRPTYLRKGCPEMHPDTPVPG